MNTLDTKRQRAANAALLTLMQQQLPQNPFGEYLLALAESDLGQESVAEAMPFPLLPAPLLPAVEAPDAPVETTPEPPPYSGDAALGGATSGDTSASIPHRPKRTYTRKPRKPEPSASAPPPAPSVKLEPEPQQQKGSAGAVFEARVYVLSCVEKNEGVNIRIVMNLTGWDRPVAMKFIHELQEEAKARKPRPTKAQRVEAGITNLLQAIENAPDEDTEEEPSDAELRAMERKSAPKPSQAAKSEKMPSWWTPENQKRCERCGEVIQPTRFGAKQYCQSFAHYQARVYCSRQCAHNNSAWKAGMPGGKKG